MTESRKITRKSASNLALAFVLLPKDKCNSMSSLYAFCREVDDVADEETVPVEERRKRLNEWREDIARACSSRQPRFIVNQELQPVIARHQLPLELFEEIIRGVEMDLDIKRYDTYGELESYCYRVASAVGLLSIEIFGYQNPACKNYAVYLGKALQLTNILRDVRGDAERGRIYLPREELDRWNVREEEILHFEYSPRFVKLAESVALKARAFYDLARSTLPQEDRRSMVAAELMGAVYWRLLRKLEKNSFNVMQAKPVKLSKFHKICLILCTWGRFISGSRSPNYGGA